LDKSTSREHWFRVHLADHFEPSEINNLIRILKEDLGDAFSTFDDKQAQQVVEQLNSDVPVQYITGIAPFYGYFFEVTEDVLIPRPETEELVYHAIKHIRNCGNDAAKIVDIGTGSGIIPITLKLEIPTAQISAVDVSPNALKIATRNGQKHDVRVDWKHLDFLDQSNWEGMGPRYDVIISNPPYIPHQEKALMHRNVLDHEPHLAMFVDDSTPLIFYEKLYHFALKKLVLGGIIMMECNEYNAQEVQAIFDQRFEAEIIKDMQGKDRIVSARIT